MGVGGSTRKWSKLLDEFELSFKLKKYVYAYFERDFLALEL